MNKLEEWFLQRVIAREVKQGFSHARHIERLYDMVRQACEKEFYEDNLVTIDALLRECFERTQFITPNNVGLLTKKGTRKKHDRRGRQ